MHDGEEAVVLAAIRAIAVLASAEDVEAAAALAGCLLAEGVEISDTTSLGHYNQW